MPMFEVGTNKAVLYKPQDCDLHALERPYFLRLINLFFNRRVLWAGLRLGMTITIMAKYERLGFLFLIFSVAF